MTGEHLQRCPSAPPQLHWLISQLVTTVIYLVENSKPVVKAEGTQSRAIPQVRGRLGYSPDLLGPGVSSSVQRAEAMAGPPQKAHRRLENSLPQRLWEGCVGEAGAGLESCTLCIQEVHLGLFTPQVGLCILSLLSSSCP